MDDSRDGVWASQSRLPFHAISARCRRLAPTLAPVSELSEADLDALIDEATVDC
jgi:hypothetical protein